MPESQQFRAIATAMLDRRIRNMRRLDEKTWVDTSLITHAEYQLFLDEMYLQGKYYQPDHWEMLRFPPSQAQSPVVGVRPSDGREFCLWLTTKYDKPFRIPTEGETDDLTVAWPGFWQKNYTGRIVYRGKLYEPNDEMKDAGLSFTSQHKKLDLSNALNLDYGFIVPPALEREINRFQAHKLADDLVEIKVRGITPKKQQPIRHALNLALDFAYLSGVDYTSKIIDNLTILSLRREGLLPAFEGILIVREETD